ncbi:MAG: cupin domain-containing protein [Clostridia bacterium]|nr:cupin domain-containing protein [Clostridia bacterium]
MRFERWRVAYLNHGDRFAEENFEKIERHNESDEVFVLLNGEATLIIGEELNRIKMEPHKLYNVPKGVWHHIFTVEGTSVLIVENEDTGDENSEFLFIKK